VLFFTFQSKNLTTRWVAVLLIAAPILIQVYFNSSLTYMLRTVIPTQPNRIEPMPRSAAMSTPSSTPLGALLVMVHPDRSASRGGCARGHG
jgi:ACR3 family arsenite efflux pump ArsB